MGQQMRQRLKLVFLTTFRLLIFFHCLEILAACGIVVFGNPGSGPKDNQPAPKQNVVSLELDVKALTGASKVTNLKLRVSKILEQSVAAQDLRSTAFERLFEQAEGRISVPGLVQGNYEIEAVFIDEGFRKRSIGYFDASNTSTPKLSDFKKEPVEKSNEWDNAPERAKVCETLESSVEFLESPDPKVVELFNADSIITYLKPSSEKCATEQDALPVISLEVKGNHVFFSTFPARFVVLHAPQNRLIPINRNIAFFVPSKSKIYSNDLTNVRIQRFSSEKWAYPDAPVFFKSLNISVGASCPDAKAREASIRQWLGSKIASQDSAKAVSFKYAPSYFDYSKIQPGKTPLLNFDCAAAEWLQGSE
jgi:hypothetical protein